MGATVCKNKLFCYCAPFRQISLIEFQHLLAKGLIVYAFRIRVHWRNEIGHISRRQKAPLLLRLNHRDIIAIQRSPGVWQRDLSLHVRWVGEVDIIGINHGFFWITLQQGPRDRIHVETSVVKMRGNVIINHHFLMVTKWRVVDRGVSFKGFIPDSYSGCRFSFLFCTSL